MFAVNELKKRFADGGASIGEPKPPPPPPRIRKPRPSATFGNANGPSTSPVHTAGSSPSHVRNLNNISSNHRRESHQDANDNHETVPEQQAPAPPPARGFHQPSFPPPAVPAQRQSPPPARNPTPSWGGQPSSTPPPVPTSARPESISRSAADLPTRPYNQSNTNSYIEGQGQGSVANSRNSEEDNATTVEYSTAGKGLSYELCTNLQQNFTEMVEFDQARGGTSRMGFGTNLQDKNAHEQILRLNDHELKLLDTFKKVVQHKIKSDRDYANSLGNIGKLTAQFNAETSITHSSPLVKSWTMFIKETDNLSKLIKQRADDMNSQLMEKIGQLICEKNDAKRQYMQERHKIDLDFQKAKDEVRDNLNKYQKCAKETKDSKTKYEECQQKGSKGKDIEKAKDRYKKSVIKFQHAHNEYVLSLKAVTLHQEHYCTSILPRLLECLQQTQESQVAQIKQMLVDVANLSNTSSSEFVSSHNSIMRGVSEIRPDQEYLDFVASNKCDPQQMETFEFDTAPMAEFIESLSANEVVLNKITLESFQHLHTQLESHLHDLQDSHKEKKEVLQFLDEEIRSIQPSTSSGVLDLLSKQKAYRDVSREIQDLRCQEAKVHVQHQTLDIKLSTLEDENELVDGIDLGEPAMGITLSRSGKSPSVSQLETTGNEWKTKSKRLPLMTMKKMFSGQKHEDSTREVPLDEEEWYHGALPRTEAEVHLINDGDFLVREKSDASGQIVLSARAEGKVRHFPIQKNNEQMYRLEGEAFPTVGELIRHQLSTQTLVTKASQAVLLKPVPRVRDEHDLRHEEIELGDKLGQGQFGDVFRATRIKDNTQVAVKTCKETVDASTRRKFLEEANILKQYNHPNIVKFIGVCTDKHPIYIVMELVGGGDLLTFLRKDQTDLTQKQMTKMGEDAAAGMAYLESKNCIHRDLAARNCLVGRKNVIKISDFGMSRQEEMYTIEHGTMRQIPIKWTAPEAINLGIYTTCSDVWSFGILLWEIFSHGSMPYPGMNNNEAREKVEQGKYTSASDVWSFGILLWEIFSHGSSLYPGLQNQDAKTQIDEGYRMPSPQGCSPEIYELILVCWKYETSERPKFREIHTSLKGMVKKMK